jgi:cell division septal protein FtsQ
VKIIKASLYFIAAFVLSSGVFLFGTHQLGLFDVKSIPVTIRDPIVPEKSTEKASVAGPAGMRSRIEAVVKPYLNRRIWQIDLKEINAAIVRDEWVKDVLISRIFPNGLRVEVSTKTPVALLVSPKGEMYPVVADGKILGSLNSDGLIDAPLLRGDGLFTNEGRRAKAVEFIAQLPDKGPLNRRNISEVMWSEDEGFSVSLMQPKTEVKLGEEKLQIKVLRVAQVMSYLSANRLKSRLVDASSGKKVLVRLRKTL